MSACKECAAPITQPARGGHRKVFCAACVVQHTAQYQREYDRERYAALTPEQRATNAQRQRDLRAAYSPEKRAAKRQAVREQTLRRKYGIGVAKFDAMLAAQGGTCAICDTDVPNGNGWHVDHNHESLAVRGILCHGCNIGIGNLKDDPATLRAAIAYIESHTKKELQ